MQSAAAVKPLVTPHGPAGMDEMAAKEKGKRSFSGKLREQVEANEDHLARWPVCQSCLCQTRNEGSASDRAGQEQLTFWWIRVSIGCKGRKSEDWEMR
jgi:hypothetical protein